MPEYFLRDAADGEIASFLTTRSRNSELWFVNNNALEDAVLAYAARYAKRYNVELYAFAIEGNHNQSGSSRQGDGALSPRGVFDCIAPRGLALFAMPGKTWKHSCKAMPTRIS